MEDRWRDVIKSSSFVNIKILEFLLYVVFSHSDGTKTVEDRKCKENSSPDSLYETSGQRAPLKKRHREKKKKKAPWYSALYPTYKSKCEDFKRIFKELPSDERLIVDYSCAVQRDILIHGRLYASQNFLCFYANIFRWETQITVRWRDITSLTKEKTALVIPNAILVQTESERYFFASFATRDKTYLMLFRIWQHALMDQPMPVPELWHWVHVCYGEELGLSTDDEDYASSMAVVGGKLPSTLTSDSFFEESTQGPKKRQEGREMPVPGEAVNGAMSGAGDNLPDLSDSSDTEDDRNTVPKESSRLDPVVCPLTHEGKLLLKEVLPGNVNDLFTLLFTFNDFNKNLMESMKYTDINVADWEENSDTALKMRIITLTVPVHQPVGPKTCKVTETQVMQACSRPGELYVIEVEAVNSGVPYCDSFYVATHYCLTWTSESETTFTVHCQLKYRKSVWGFVKGFIEKNVWAGLEEFYEALRSALITQCAKKEPLAEIEEIKVQKVEAVTRSAPMLHAEPKVVGSTSAPPPAFSLTNDLTLWAILGVLTVLLLLNAVLYYKLSVLEDYDRESTLSSVIDSQILSRERSHDQWVALLRSQAVQHYKGVQQWRTALKSIVSLLKQAEDSITDLHSSIHSAVNERVLEALKPLSSLDDIVLSNKRNEL
ncbi:protein Aster-B-like [Macrosteles quadrilineatus]|uniref:protein Aster-B-like n=1 Tax=Macrosteles quadrilineatus TaxID=74068 RepID=UPI0023E08FCA|nr:protein Aster-B-like [Macrosteles quadrilineatus]